MSIRASVVVALSAIAVASLLAPQSGNAAVVSRPVITLPAINLVKPPVQIMPVTPVHPGIYQPAGWGHPPIPSPYPGGFGHPPIIQCKCIDPHRPPIIMHTEVR